MYVYATKYIAEKIPRIYTAIYRYTDARAHRVNSTADGFLKRVEIDFRTGETFIVNVHTRTDTCTRGTSDTRSILYN